ncbi:MAG: leucine-rich repeat domain-containing protein, partial [Clostridia bacterium]
TINNVEYNVISIRYRAFINCDSLISVTLPNSVISIGNGAFYDCNNLISITLPSSVTSIGDWAFYNCDSLKSITLPSGVMSIGEAAFYSCNSLSSINFPSSLTRIGSEAFYNCSNLISITLPSSVTSIGDNAFERSTIIFTDALGKLYGWSCEANYYGCDLNTFATINGISYVVKNGNAIIAYCVRSIETAIIPSKVTINNVEYNVTSIGNDVFCGCISLSSVILPNSVTSIGSGAFSGCSSLNSITLPSSVISIGNYAFERSTIIYTDALTKPDGWSCEADYYYGCDLNTFTTINGISYIVKNGNAIIVSCERSLETVIIPSKVTIKNVEYNVTSIGKRAFSGCSSLSSITLPSSLTRIGSGAVNSSTMIFTDALTKPDGWDWSCEADYYGCDLNTFATINGISYVVKNGNAIAASCKRSLETVIIPSKVTINNVEYNVTSIGNWAFSGCANLTTITLPSSVTSIGNRAFSACSSLSSVTLPSSVTSIGNGAFYECSSLKSITLPSSVTSIGDGVFSYCINLGSINFPSSVTSIGNWAFYNCSSLSSITLPSSVISIGKYAFEYCISLSSITLPSSVTSIGEEAFGRSTIIFTDALTKPDGWSWYRGTHYYGCDLNNFATINGISYLVKNGNAIIASCERSLETA